MKRYSQTLFGLLVIGTLLTLFDPMASFGTVVAVFIFGNVCFIRERISISSNKYAIFFYATFPLILAVLMLLAPALAPPALYLAFIYITFIPSGVLAVLALKAIKLNQHTH